MTTSCPTTSVDYFEQKYQQSADPWNFAQSSYERDRYRTTLSALQKPRYRHAFEPGCSIGELTASLGRICDRVTATDISQTACNRAMERCADLSSVQIRCGDIGVGLPPGDFDLIVLSEVAYYFDTAKLESLARQLSARLEYSGELIAVHWLGHSPDHVLHGDQAHDVLQRSLPLTHVRHDRYEHYRLDAWIKA